MSRNLRQTRRVQEMEHRTSMKKGHRTSSSRSQPGTDTSSKSRGLQSLDEKLLQVGKKFPEVYFEDDTPAARGPRRPNTASATRRSTDDGHRSRKKSSGGRNSPSRSRSGSNITSSTTTTSSRGPEGGLRILRSKSGHHSNPSTTSSPTKASSPKRPSTASSMRRKHSNKESGGHKQRAASLVDVSSTTPLCSVIPEDDLRRFEKRAETLTQKFAHDKEVYSSHDKTASNRRSSKSTGTERRPTRNSREEFIGIESSYSFSSKDLSIDDIV